MLMLIVLSSVDSSLCPLQDKVVWQLRSQRPLSQVSKREDPGNEVGGVIAWRRCCRMTPVSHHIGFIMLFVLNLPDK